MDELGPWLTQNLDTLEVLLRRRETAIGVATGLLASWGIVWVWSVRRRGRPETAAATRWYGAVWIAAGVVALQLARGVPVAVAVAIVVAGASRGDLRSPARFAAVAAAGAWIALTVPGGGLAGRVAVAVALPVAVASAGWWVRRGGGRLLPWLLAVTLLGHVAVLPDVEEVLALAAVGGLLALATLPPLRAGFGEGAAAGAAALVVWTAGVGGYGRASAVVGGLAALGLMVATPVGTSLVRAGRLPTGKGVVLAAVLTHVATVAAVTRNAGLRADATSAWVVAGGVLAVAAVASALTATVGGDRAPPPRDGP